MCRQCSPLVSPNKYLNRKTTTMKQSLLMKFSGPALGIVLAATIVRADIPIHENKISLYGYAAGSARQTWQGNIHPSSNDSDSTLALDAAKLGLAFDYDPVKARLSAFVPSTEGNTSEDIYLLEANVSYRTQNDMEFTFGRFQSWIGYEAFDIPNQNFITAATTSRLSIIPTFHEGVKFEMASGKYTYGAAILDSIYGGTADDPYCGDGDLGNGYGVEAFAGWKGEKLMGRAALAYQSDKTNNHTDTWVFDAYGEYALPFWGTILGGEVCVRTDEPLASSTASGQKPMNNRTNTLFGLIMIKQPMSANNTLYLRLSAGHEKTKIYNNQSTYDDGTPVYDGGTKTLFTKFSMAFNHSLGKHVDFRGEASYTDYTNTHQASGQIAKETFLGIQIVLKL